jgi:putative ABC transport system permease protein
MDAIRALPGIRSAAATMSPPGFGGAPDVSFPAGPGKGGGWIVSAGFFRTMGVKLIAGREFDDREGFSGAPVAVLNQAAARLLFGDGEAVGREVRAPKQPTRTVVGVVADTRQSFKAAAEPAMYVPFDRSTFRFADTIVDADDTPALREQIRRAILRVSRDSDVAIEPLAALLDRDVAVLRFSMRVIAAFAVLTVLLAMLGVYGVITFIAGERLREYGVRVALGASRQAIATLVLRHAVVPIGAGVIAGLVVSAWAARLLAAEILDVSPASVVTFLIASSALLVCGVLAASVPARRATRVDPMIVLRAE